MTSDSCLRVLAARVFSEWRGTFLLSRGLRKLRGSFPAATSPHKTIFAEVLEPRILFSGAPLPVEIEAPPPEERGMALVAPLVGAGPPSNAMPDAESATEAGGVMNASAGAPASGNVLDNDLSGSPDSSLAVHAVSGDGSTFVPVIVDSVSLQTDPLLPGAATTLAGSFGTLSIGGDGSYRYEVDNGNALINALDSGDSLTDTFSYRLGDGRFAEVNGVISGEAEEFAINAPGADAWEVIDATENSTFGGPISGGELMQALPDGGAFSPPPALGNVVQNPFLEYDIEVDTAGLWQLYIKAAGFDTASDSIYASIVEKQDGVAGGDADWFLVTTDGNPVFVTWQGEGRRELATYVDGSFDIPMTWDLASGDYTLRVWSREDGVAFDAWSLVNVEDSGGVATGNPVPTGFNTVDSTVETDETTLSITIEGANDAPEARDDSDSIAEPGGAPSITTATITGNVMSGVSANGVGQGDVDPDGDDDPAAAVNVAVTNVRFSGTAYTGPGAVVETGLQKQGAFGFLQLQADGRYQYQLLDNPSDPLDEGDSVIEEFVYEITDSSGASSEASLRITVFGTDDDPVAVHDVISVVEAGGSVFDEPTRNGSSVLANDGDVDADDNPAQTASVTQISFAGVPYQTVNAGGAVGAGGTAIDGQFLTLVIFPDGTFQYQLDDSTVDFLQNGETRSDVFTYSSVDSHGATSSAEIRFTINGANDNPLAEDNLNRVEEDAVLVATGNLLIDSDGLDNHPDNNPSPNPSVTVDTDVDNPDSDFAVIPVGGVAGVPRMGVYGTLLLSSDGTYRYDLNNALPAVQQLSAGEVVVDAFAYRVFDGAGGFDEAQLFIEVQGRNDEPNAVRDFALLEGSAGANSVPGNLLTNDIDPDRNGPGPNDVLTVVDVSFGAPSFAGGFPGAEKRVSGIYGALLVSLNGDFVYTLNAESAAAAGIPEGEVREELFFYRMSDGNGGFSEESIVVRIRGGAVPEVETLSLVGGSGVLEGFRFAGLNRLEESESFPLVSTGPVLIPFYSGIAAPGSVITVRIGGAGASGYDYASRTVVAGTSGMWAADFTEFFSLEGDKGWYVEVETERPFWNDSTTGQFAVFFSPSLPSLIVESEALSVTSVLGRSLESLERKQIGPSDLFLANRDWRSRISLSG